MVLFVAWTYPAAFEVVETQKYSLMSFIINSQIHDSSNIVFQSFFCNHNGLRVSQGVSECLISTDEIVCLIKQNSFIWRLDEEMAKL